MFKRIFPVFLIVVSGCLNQSVVEKNEEDIKVSPLTKPAAPDMKWKEMKYSDSNPVPVLNAEENARGFMLFSRPLETVVYSETKPLAEERLKNISGFAAEGEIKVLTLSLFPVRNLENFNLKISPLANSSSRIPVRVRMQTYWNVRYPHYNSTDTYRRVPELLEKIPLQYNIPALETQRYWLQINVPENAVPGIYKSKLTLSCNGMKQPLDIPVSFRVMPFKLRQDPAKHFSAFNYDLLDKINDKTPEDEKKQRVSFAGKEYRTMQDYGIDTIPPLDLRYDSGKDMLYVRNGDLIIDNAIHEGLKGPITVHVGGIAELYKKYMGKSERAKSKVTMPPEKFFTHLTNLVKKFEIERKKKGWPEVIYMPMDEISVEAADYGSACYKAVRAAGVSTWATKDPVASDAKDYSQYLDFWCSQPFSVSYTEIQADKKHGYWCYPNHNACEVRIPEAMCIGGRMTYGFGFWKSGYTMLVPWIWRWSYSDKPDYLAKKRSDCGFVVSKEGDVIPTPYWECFRAGVNDGRYIYTLQCAIKEKENNPDPECKALVKSARELLQRIWSGIDTKIKYLDNLNWVPEEFDNKCLEMAVLIEKLGHYKGTYSGTVPSVIIDTAQYTDITKNDFKNAQEKGNVTFFDLLDKDLKNCASVTGEGKVYLSEKSSTEGEKSLCFEVTVDHEKDGGGENGKYPVGWPRINIKIADSLSDLSSFDYFIMNVMISSGRDEISDDNTPAYLIFKSGAKNKTLKTMDILGTVEERQWIPIVIPVSEILQNNSPEDSSKFSTLTFGIREREYKNNTNMKFYISNIGLIKFKNPEILSIKSPESIVLPCDHYLASVDIAALEQAKKGNMNLVCEIMDSNNKKFRSNNYPISGNSKYKFDIGGINPGTYKMDLFISDKNGNKVSNIYTKNIYIIKGL